jgi:opacity protein-like surface antigen
MYYMTGGDYNNIIQGRMDYYNSLSDFSITSNLEKLTLSANFGAELVLDFTDNVGVGLGVGFLHATNDGSVQATNGSLSLMEELTPLVTSWPIMLNLHVTIPITEKVNIHFSAGPGLYLSTFQFDRTTDDSSLSLDETLSFDSSTCVSLGFQGTLGIEYGISDTVFMLVEATGRSAYASNVNGPWTLNGGWVNGAISGSGSGTVWYEEVQSSPGGNYYPDMTIKDTEPILSTLRNVRSAKISLGGFGLQVGLKFYL